MIRPGANEDCRTGVLSTEIPETDTVRDADRAAGRPASSVEVSRSEMVFLCTALTARAKGMGDERLLLVYHAGGCCGVPRGSGEVDDDDELMRWADRPVNRSAVFRADPKSHCTEFRVPRIHLRLPKRPSSNTAHMPACMNASSFSPTALVQQAF